ncbi:HpcH/HpaI aldolase/citrate lyase family protein [Actinokineospora soli]|uniref:HpcH/HpaI aldolase/citrate lyase family protein n=1 Tax=Actinokineospora soli TaxID=1048753 RepID=A0ABW2TJ30_9PSEU
MSFVPRRSVLYMPGANERALEKAKTLPADALILDLEDSVAPDAKADGRKRVCEAVGAGGYGRRELTIRVNGIDTEWHADDLRAAAEAGRRRRPQGQLRGRGARHRARAGGAGAPDTTKIWAMVETPIAMLRAHEIAAASERLTVLVMGTNDLAKELHAEHVPGRAPLLGGLSLALLGARAAGKVILDGVYNDVKDLDGFTAECRQGREFGFDGKTLIHPGQIGPCNEVFAPSAAEVEHARKVIAAFEEAAAEGRGVVTVDGRMIENLHVDNARRILDVDAAIRAAGDGV